MCTLYYRTAPHRTAPHRTAPHRTAPHRTAPHRNNDFLIVTRVPTRDAYSNIHFVFWRITDEYPHI
jgi:hypothetical protein